ncbi:D-alanyl-D-alanine carboxypeptidase [Streptomyces sp. NBC_01613]|uniref:D-alanyl-D-alanine carboxypeptidase n=1 Tax=Streptomyces sp. NBC_01613 TaxID=2975896 RepID=UPI003869497B
MAGESPDRSKQRESSAEPTSGSTGPVPEARTEERGSRDPRLAVARDAAEAGGSSSDSSADTSGTSSASGESEARGGVDTATRVFSVRDLKVEAEGSGDAGGSGADESGAGGSKSDRSEAVAATGDSADTADGDDAVTTGDEAAVAAGGNASADGAATSDGDGATGSGDGDARLRAAVAAWVRSGDSKGPGDSGGEETAAEDDGTEGDAAEDAGSAAADDGEQSGEAVADAVDDDDDDDDDVADKVAESASQADAGSETDAEPESDADGDEPEAADDGERAAGVDEAASGADDPAKADAEPESGTAADSDVTADEAPEAPKDTTAKDPRTVTADAAAPEAAADDTAAAETPEADGETEPDDGEPADTDDSAAAADETASDDAPAPADGEDTPKGSPSPADESGTGGADAKKTTPRDGEAKRVDQPTAVFKRPAPQVDQPTTMLKLGGAPKAPKTPESAAERTSKFVALKPLDEPPAKKPADATGPVPQVGPERTAQQPLPPKPPLDLLAELTNTPPPPQTPVRTIVRRVKIWTPLVLLLAVAFAIAQAVRPLPTPSLTLTADDSYTFGGSKADLPWPSEGQGWMDVNGIGTMGDFGKQTPVAIGSVAKAMTAYLVLKDHPMKSGEEGEKIAVDALAEKEGGYDKDGESTLNTVKKGDTLTEKQALSAIMIPSANNIARLLARWDAGSEAAFIKKMNDTAKDLGMKNTTYTDASGLKETTVSTAEDQVKLGNELVKIPALMDITKLPNWIDPSGQKWRNYNSLVPYNGAIGIKTGTTTKAGGNLLFAATKEVGGETVTVVGAILGQHTAPIIDTVNAVSKTAMLAAQDELTSKKILKKGDVVGYVDDRLGGHTPIVLTEDVTAVGWAGFKVKLSFAADKVPHTAKAGAKVGTLTVGDGTSGAVKVPVALQKDLAEPGFTAKLKRLG